MPQIKIPAVYYRGGTSKGIFFKRTDLPAAAQEADEARDKILTRRSRCRLPFRASFHR